MCYKSTYLYDKLISILSTIVNKVDTILYLNFPIFGV